MRKAKLMVSVWGISLMLLTGCSDASNSSVDNIIVETVDFDQKLEEQKKETDLDAGKGEGNADQTETENKYTDLSTSEVPKTNLDTSKFTDELYGDVTVVNYLEKYVIVSRIYTEGDEIFVAPAEGNSDEELITVYFTDEAEYILETGKADGSDVSQSKVSFSDITEDDTLILTGTWDTKGEEFLASDVKIIRVIN